MKKIMIIEDNLDNLKLLSWVLEDAGFSFTTFINAESALEELNNNNIPDLILLDVSLPVMDGKQAVRIIRSKERLKNIPVLAVTAHAIIGETQEILEAGFDEIITKPIDEEEILAKISLYLGKNDYGR